MTRRDLLRWTAIAAFSVSITLLLLSDHHNSAAAKTKTQVQEKAGLHVMIDGKAVSDCPLKHTDVKAEVSGFLSRVTVTQEFENPYAEKIEAVYTFPLPPGAAVDDLTMQIGPRVVKGKIMRREEARAAYESAKSLGKAASLLDQERPNIFTQSVANIMPGQPISVTISYVETLKYSDGFYEWSFPTVVARRYLPASNKKQPGDECDAAQETSEADTTRLNPPLAEGGHAGHGLSLEVAIDAGVPVEILSSRTHEIELARVDDRRAVVRLKDQKTLPNKDFVLLQSHRPKVEDAVLAHRTREEGFFTLILQPPEARCG
jgi:Ca-activated chloride channel family protein